MKKKKSNLFIQPSCSIKYIRNKNYFVFTNDNQKIGYELVNDFPWKKKNILEEAYQILADRYYNGDLNRTKKAFKIVTLIKYCYPEVIFNY